MEQVSEADRPRRHRLIYLLPTALRYRPFWLGVQASVSGSQTFRFTQFWLMFELTGSSLTLGYVGLANTAPAVVVHIFGSVLADRLDRRKLIFVTQVIIAGLVFLLATITLFDQVKVWHVLAVAMLVSAVEGVGQPAIHAYYPQLIEPRAYMGAVVALKSPFSVSMIIAPVVIAFAGTSLGFYIAGLGFLIMAGFIRGLPSSTVHAGQRGIAEGLRLIRRKTVLGYLLLLGCVSSLFGTAYATMMPVLAVDLLESGTGGTGLLFFGIGAGGALTSIFLAYWITVRYQGAMVIFGTAAFGLFVGAFALTALYLGSMVLAISLMFFMGIVETAYVAAIQSSIQLNVPDRLRGRVMGFYSITAALQPISGLLAGGLANLITAPLSVAVSGLVVSSFVGGSVLTSGTVRRLAGLRPRSA